MFADRLFQELDRAAIGLADRLGLPAHRQVQLETAKRGSSTLVLQDGTLATVLSYAGVTKLFDSTEPMIEALFEQIAGNIASGAQGFQVVIEYDPDTVRDHLERQYAATRQSINNMDLAGLHEVLDDTLDRVAEYTATERVFIVLYTQLGVLPSRSYKAATKEMIDNDLSVPSGARGQRESRYTDAHRDSHEAFVIAFEQALSRCGALYEKLDAHRALWWVRRSVDPDFTSPNWRPTLVGDPAMVRGRDPGEHARDASPGLYPRLEKQVWPREAQPLGRNLMQIGDKVHAPLLLEQGPADPTPFDRFFEKTVQGPRFPWRIAFLIGGEGLRGLDNTIQQVLARTLSWVPASNARSIRDALDYLGQLQRDDIPVPRMKIVADTWTYGDGHTNSTAVERARMQSSYLATHLQTWGDAEPTESVGDPLLAISAAVPALTLRSPATALVPPLGDALHMLPLTRPALPWSSGSLLLRTPDGRPAPYAPCSSVQASWIDITFGQMGMGKSAFLTAMRVAFVLQPDLKELPYLSTIDVGPSSVGFIRLLQNLLPAQQRNQAVHARLQNRREAAINPFDTPLGHRYPPATQTDWLENLLMGIIYATTGENPPDVRGPLRTLIIDAYRRCDDGNEHGQARAFSRQIDPRVTRHLDDEGFVADDETTWWEVVDWLMENNQVALAYRAQRYAVPLMPDLGIAANDPVLKSQFTHEARAGEDVLHFLHRKLAVEGPEMFPIFAEYTQWDFGAARVIAVDMEDVAPKGRPEQSAVMYLYARQLVAGHFFLREDVVEQSPPLYRDYHRQRLQKLASTPKRLDMDEIHRTRDDGASLAGGQSVLMRQFTADLNAASRETRKWILSIGLASQNPEDFPQDIIELATSTYMLGVATNEQLQNVRRRYGLTDAATRRLRRITQPNRRGSRFVAVYKTNVGEIHQELVLTLGPQLLWALSTNGQDAQIRDRLYRHHGVGPTLAHLARRYPDGRADADIKRRQESEDADPEDPTAIEAIIAECDEEIRSQRHAPATAPLT